MTVMIVNVLMIMCQCANVPMCQCANWLLLAPRFARICDIRCSFSVGGFCFIDFPRQGEDRLFDLLTWY